MSIIKKSISTALCIVLAFSIIFSPADKPQNKQIMFFPGLSFGYAESDHSDKKVEVVESDKDIKFSLKILELFAELF